MKARELMEELFAQAKEKPEDTVDTCKCGDPEKEIHKVATCFIATVEVIRAAHKWGADLLITHEPTFYDHRDYRGDLPDDEVIQRKKKLLDETGMTVYRLHDHMHDSFPDSIVQGQIDALGWKGEFDGLFHLELESPMTAREMAAEIEKKWGVRHVRMTGDLDTPMAGVGMMVGSFGDDNQLSLLRRKEYDVIIVGETCEWRIGEYVRDEVLMGAHKALLTCGHAGSERDGMNKLQKDIQAAHLELECTYVECGEVYTYLN